MPGALNCYTLSRLILLTLYVSRNLTLAHLPLSGFLDSMLCILIALTPILAFFLPMPCTVAVASSFSSGRAYPSLACIFSELSTSSLSLLDPYSHYVGINISLNNFSSLSFLNVYAPPIRYSLMDGRTDSFPHPFFSPPEISSFWRILIAITPTLGLKSTSDFRGEEIFDWIISSDLLPLNYTVILTLLHSSCGSCASPDISFAPFSLALSLAPGRCFRT